jgi:teichoic acid transport system permease protein
VTAPTSSTAPLPPRSRRADTEFSAGVHVYEPHRAGLPKLKPYFQELWGRRHFAVTLAHTDMRAAHTATFFGQMWLIINPLLLALVYLLLVDVISGRPQGLWYFSHLLSGLFVFYFVSGAIIQGSNIVVQEGGLIMNQAFPRLLLPLTSVYVAVRRFLPTLSILVVFHFLSGTPTTIDFVWLIPIFAEIVLFTAGLACFFAAVQVYFRDMSQFLPYFTRIWLYVSPVIYTVAQIKQKHTLAKLELLNPLMALLGNWTQVFAGEPVCRTGKAPSCKVIDHIQTVGVNYHYLAIGFAWAVGVFAIGALFYISRERDFAVRL